MIAQATPLPKVQLTALMFVHICGPITATVIFPFIAKLVNEVGVTHGDEAAVGYYVGLIVQIAASSESHILELISCTHYRSLYSSLQKVLAQSPSISYSAHSHRDITGICILQWGRLSDRIGRRPVLCIGLFGLAASMTCFGLSKSFSGLVLSRALSGALNGNSGVMKSMVAEMTDETNQAAGFSFIPIAWIAGATIGPLLGGSLQHPADHWPSIFSHMLWTKYPYLLPCLVAALFPVLGVVVAATVLNETLPSFVRKQNSSEETTPLLLNTESPSDVTEMPPLDLSLRALLTRPVAVVILNYASIAIIEIAFLALLPVFLAVPISLNGLGLKPAKIGRVLALIGVGGGLVQMLLFPPVHKRFGGKKVFVAAIMSWFVTWMSIPLMHRVALATPGYSGDELPYGVVLLLILVGLMTVISDMGYSCMFVAMSSAVASPDVMGSTNGIAQTSISFVRAVGPATATALFSFSVEHNIAEGYMVYIVLFGITCLALVGTTLFPNDRPRSNSEEEDLSIDSELTL